MASMPSWMSQDYVNSYYQSNHLASSGAYLKTNGYDVSFYHGGENGTMSFNNFIAITGGGSYYGMNEYPDKNDYDGNWGIYDEPYLQYVADQLNHKPRPFFATVFTLSSHHPYRIPEIRQQQFTEGTLPIHRTIRYTDHSLRQFFEAAKKTDWYKNTVFIITADHSAENEQDYYQTSQGKYEIPFFVFDPSQDLSTMTGEYATHTFQQLDILPLVLEYGHYPRSYFSFGKMAQQGGAIQYFDHIYQLVQWPYIYQFNGEKPVAFYRLDHDPLMSKNLLDQQLPQQARMDTLLKSVIQQYGHALVNNQTFAE
jgi:phosphoglycerol transferase MdoB-like AlkP superfamily enzyme